MTWPRRLIRWTMLRAEWAHVANPVRIEALADKNLGGQVMQLSQIVSITSLPDKVARGDEIGKLLDLGISKPTNTPASSNASTATPSTSKAAPSASKTGR